MSFPFIATLVFLGGLGYLVWSLFLSARRYRAAAKPEEQAKLPDDFGPRLTSKRLRYVRWAFALLVLATFGFHIYWGLFATGPLGENTAFAALKNKRDMRNRRDAEANLRGWIFDRHRDNRRALAKYRYLNGQIIRDYPLSHAAAHLIGYSDLVRGDAMMERAVAVQPEPKEGRSWWQKLTSFTEAEKRIAVGPDLTLTIDFEFQKEAYAQLQAALQNKKGQAGAVVVLNPQTGEVLALASAPSFDPDDIGNNAKWPEISRDAKRKPLLNRALHEYYLPGSTLKTITAAAAVEARLEQVTFICKGEGWTPPNSGRAIRDDEGEAHGSIGLTEAFVHSCNQYFAQLGVEVERERMGEAASRFGLQVFAKPEASIGAGFERGLWNTENKILADVFAPLKSTFVNGSGITKYDLALESIGQGFVQLTPLQMALVAAGVANKQGLVMKPMLESGRQPAALGQAMSVPVAVRTRELMAAVVERGTASGTFGALIRGKTTAGGKTGTAQREVPVIDPQTNKPVIIRDARGRERIKKEHRIDSWFIGFAPLENPQVAFAVVVEGGGYGARTSAPIAGNLLLKARESGLLGLPPLATQGATPQRNDLPAQRRNNQRPATNAARQASETARKR